MRDVKIVLSVAVYICLTVTSFGGLVSIDIHRLPYAEWHLLDFKQTVFELMCHSPIVTTKWAGKRCISGSGTMTKFDE